MAGPKLKTVTRTQGNNQALKDGSVTPKTFEFAFEEVDPLIAAFRRMVRGNEFDICEMAITTYICAKAFGKPMTAVPVPLVRAFHHGAILTSAKAGITNPKDLEGKKVGVNRGYTVTTGVWARGILQQEYGVDLGKITWVPTDDEHVLNFDAPGNVDTSHRGKPMKELLLNGTVDAALGEVGVEAPEIKPLIPDARNVAFDYFRRTGIYPINHGVVVKNTLLKDKPWIADELMRAFEESKAVYMKNLEASAGLSSWDRAAADNAAVVGDPFPFSIEKNRKALEAITKFAADQKMVPRKFSVEELFTPTD
jgi:4,5-dihydroxyphthalate decarboxylase